MRNIERHINAVERMLASSAQRGQKHGLPLFSFGEAESLRAIVDVAKTINNLLDQMDRLVRAEDGE